MVTSHAFTARKRARIDPSLAEHAASLLAQIDTRLRDAFERSDPLAVGSAVPIACATSKRVRPALVLATAEAVGLDNAVALDVATAVELLHTFSLIHDDIEDGSALRRGLPAVHTTVGVPLAINTGDAVHVLAWTSLLSVDAPSARVLELGRQFGTTLERMVAGQARDLLWTRDRPADISLADYIEMVRGKTGALLGFAAAAPAILTAHPSAGTLASFGEELGIAFQILDDVASLCASSAVLGKPVGANANGAGSAPALLSIAGRDGTEAAVQLARSYWQRAWTALDAADLPHDAALCALTEAIIEQLLARHGG
jgi:geranylgeranyl diphosphate synthase type I